MYYACYPEASSLAQMPHYVYITVLTVDAVACSITVSSASVCSLSQFFTFVTFCNFSYDILCCYTLSVFAPLIMKQYSLCLQCPSTDSIDSEFTNRRCFRCWARARARARICLCVHCHVIVFDSVISCVFMGGMMYAEGDYKTVF